MREVVALLVFLAIAGLGIHLAVRKKIGNLLAAILLVFSLMSGWTIANFDWVQRVQWEVPGLEAFHKQIQNDKEETFAEVRKVLDSMRKEVEGQTASLDLVISKAREMHDGMGEEMKSVHAALESMRQLETAMKSEERVVKEMSERSEQMRQQVAAIHEASSNLALSITRLTWLLLEAREEYGAERAETAVRHIMDGLDEIVGIVIPDPNARSEFVTDVMSSMPPRQQH